MESIEKMLKTRFSMKLANNYVYKLFLPQNSVRSQENKYSNGKFLFGSNNANPQTLIRQNSGVSPSRKLFFSRFKSSLANSDFFKPVPPDPLQEARLDALRKEVWGKAIQRSIRLKESLNSIKTQLYCKIAQFCEKHLNRTPNMWANVLVFFQNLLWGGKMNTFEKEKQKEEAIWKSIEGKYSAKIIKDTRLYMDILDYYWYKTACVPTLDEAKMVFETLYNLDDDITLCKKNRTGLSSRGLMDADGYIIREFSPEINRRTVRLSLMSNHRFPLPKTEPELSILFYEKALKIRVPFSDLEEPIQKGQEPKYSVPDYYFEDSNKIIQEWKEGYAYMKKYTQKVYGGEP